MSLIQTRCSKLLDEFYHWRVELILDDNIKFEAESESKKDAKMEVAKQVITYLIEQNELYLVKIGSLYRSSH